MAGHLLVGYIDPYLLSILRWGFTSLLMFSLYWRVIRKDWHLLTENLAINSLFSLLGQVSFPLTLYIGLQYTSSLNAAIYISATPCLVLIINFLFFKEHISKRNVIGAVVSTIGVIYLALSDVNGESQFASFGVGDVLTIISALSWAFYCALLRKKDKRITHTSFVSFCSLIGTVMLIPIYLAFLFFSRDSLTLSMPEDASIYPALGVAYLVIFPSWLSYVFWNKGVAMIGTTRSEIFTHIIPVSGGLLSIVLLDEQIHLYHVIALVMIIFGIVCCSGKNKEKSSITATPSKSV
ncbi:MULTISPECIES: DMT family transporter [Morganellaceae]|uniref:DMT family transporter n=1 Tax=Morganellaceae TaxID=1903414 RepID=UPI001F5F9B8A|nr:MULTISPECIES: DMT family transporter [Morganellaceae]